MRSVPAFLTLLLTCLLMATGVETVQGQCLLSDPSFEMRGNGGQAFTYWQQFGPVGYTTNSSHGQTAARISGPNTGGWDVAGVWQSMDCSAGEQWAVTGNVLNPSSRPLSGDNTAVVNIEWRDAGDALISYDSFTVATAATPQDSYFEFNHTSSPAPVGTAQARLVLGNLQSPTDPTADVYFDQVTFYSTTPPTNDDVQWNDFPGGRVVNFSGQPWRVKGTGFYGPGANVFSDAADKVWVDGSGYLHLTLTNNAGTWNSTEVVLNDALGYGDYVLTTMSDLDELDPQAVLGMFLWEYAVCYDFSYTQWNAFNEIDIEYSRWQDPGKGLAQFVAQPYDYPGNIERFDPIFNGNEVVSHAIRWLSDRVEYRVWRGGPNDESPATLIHQWTYTGPHIPRPEQPRLHLNLWRIDGAPASDQEVVFTDFNFVPVGSQPPETGIPVYAQDFENLNPADTAALAADGWLVYGNVFDGGGNYLYGYGAFPAPNDPASPAFSLLASGEGGVDQGAQQLVVISDYQNTDHANNLYVEANVYHEATIDTVDVGYVFTFAFDAKRGDIAGSSTARAFIKTLDPTAGFATTSVVNVDLTTTPTTWAGYSLSLPISPDLVGQLLQFGFSSTATLYQGSAVFYDNVGLAKAVDPSDVPQGQVPVGLHLRQNYPNPFNPSTRIEFSLGQPGNVALLVYDVAGRHIATLHQGPLTAGDHRMAWNGKTDAGLPVAAGRYNYVLRTDAAQTSRSMILLK